MKVLQVYDFKMCLVFCLSDSQDLVHVLAAVLLAQLGDQVAPVLLRVRVGGRPSSSKYKSQDKSIPSEVHNAAIITCARTSLSINESCEFPLKPSFI